MEHKDDYELDRIPFYFSVSTLLKPPTIQKEASSNRDLHSIQRPDLRPPRLNIVTRDNTSATPGYLFTSPSFTGAYRPDSGPYIFDTNGVCFPSPPPHP